MTKEDVLQKANEYCNEKSYNEETLTEVFKSQFSDFFSKKYPETAVDDEAMIADLKFNLDTAFSAVSKGLSTKQKAFEGKEAEYQRQIEELKKKTPQATPPAIPKELQDQLDELKRFREESALRDKYNNVIALAKKGIREDLHKSFDTYAAECQVNLKDSDEEQAKKLTARFQEIFKDTISDIKPLAPRIKEKEEEEFIKNVRKVTIG